MNELVQETLEICGLKTATPGSYLAANANSEEAAMAAEMFLRELRRQSGGQMDRATDPALRDEVILKLSSQLTQEGMTKQARILLSLITSEASRDKAMLQQLNAASAESDFEGERMLMAEIATMKPKDPELIRRYMRLNRTHNTASRLDIFAMSWGGLPDSIEDALANLLDHSHNETVNQSYMDFAFENTKTGISDYDEFEDKVVWGNLATNYILQLHRALKAVLTSGRRGSEYTPEQVKWAREKLRELMSMIDTIDLEHPQEVLKSGRSLVVTMSHSGPHHAAIWAAERQRIPFARIGQAGGGAGGIAVGEDRSSAAILSLAKKAKAQSLVIGLTPDGRQGANTPIPFMGGFVSLGQGAPALSWLSKAENLFFTIQWEGYRMNVVPSIGPNPAEFTEKDAFFDAWNTWYTDRLEEIVTGDPRNMGMTAGFWAG